MSERVQEEGVSHSRAPAGARLEWGLREPPPAASATHARCPAAGPSESRMSLNFSSGAGLSEVQIPNAPKCLQRGKVMGVGTACQSPAP